ncbi:hypothetical protein ACW7EJ_18450 [Acinetobacter soli]
MNTDQHQTEKIKESYYKQIKRFNNEVFPEHFLIIKEAYEYLSDPVRRKNYLLKAYNVALIFQS